MFQKSVWFKGLRKITIMLVKPRAWYYMEKTPPNVTLTLTDIPTGIPSRNELGFWDSLNIKIPSHQCRDSHCKDKRVSRPSYINNGNPHTWKDCLYVETGPYIPSHRAAWLYHSKTETKWTPIFAFIFKLTFLEENWCILIQIPLNSAPRGQLDNKSDFAQLMSWCRIGCKQLDLTQWEHMQFRDT